MKADNITEYENAWRWHINQIAILALAADVEYAHYISVKTMLETWLKYAIEHQSIKDLENGRK